MTKDWGSSLLCSMFKLAQCYGRTYQVMLPSQETVFSLPGQSVFCGSAVEDFAIGFLYGLLRNNGRTRAQRLDGQL